MPELWLDNPRKFRPRGARPRVAVSLKSGTLTLGQRSPLKGRVHRVNPEGGVLMLANKRRRTHRRKREMPPALKAYWASHRRGRKSYGANPRRRQRSAVVAHVVRYRRNPRGAVGGFVPSMGALQGYAMTAAGMVAPSLVTDRLLPMFGIVLTGWMRRGVQFLVPGAVQMFGGRLLGKNAAPFIAGGYAVTVLGVVNDLTGNFPGMVGGYGAGVRKQIAGYQRGVPARTLAPAPAAGAY